MLAHAPLIYIGGAITYIRGYPTTLGGLRPAAVGCNSMRGRPEGHFWSGARLASGVWWEN